MKRLHYSLETVLHLSVGRFFSEMNVTDTFSLFPKCNRIIPPLHITYTHEWFFTLKESWSFLTCAAECKNRARAANLFPKGTSSMDPLSELSLNYTTTSHTAHLRCSQCSHIKNSQKATDRVRLFFKECGLDLLCEKWHEITYVVIWCCINYIT